MPSNKTSITEETTTTFLAKKHSHGKILHSSTLEVYNEAPIFISVDIAEDVVKLATQKLSGSLAPGGIELEALQGWLLKVGEDSKKL